MKTIQTATDYFAGKQITVMGLGLLGRGLGDAAFLADCGAEVIVTDLKDESVLEAPAAELRPYPNVTLKLGGHDVADFQDRDFVLVAAGVPLDSPYLAHAREHGVPLKMSGELLAELSDLPLIGVTGTRGKSTVTQLIAHGLRHADKRVLVGGNVRGVSNLQLLHEAAGVEVLVMELDSWQLQGFGWAERSPHIAVFTNFMEDHLDYYDSMEQYFADKANIYRFQKPGDVLIAGRQVAQEWIAATPPAYGFLMAEPVPSDWQLLLPGAHNWENVALGAAALRAYGLTEEQVKAACETFTGVEGRLQYVKTSGEVEIYNDNNATTPTATAAALNALAREQNVVLICGGTDKGVPVGGLAAAIARYTKHVVLYAGSGTEVLKKELGSDVSWEEHATLKECVAAAMAAATPGDILLFSPAFSSFGKEYKNEYDRNDQFLTLVEELFA